MLRSAAGPFVKTAVSFAGTVSKTRQADLEAADINKIVGRFLKGNGDVSALHTRHPQYGDFEMTNDLQMALNDVNDARVAFASLPAKVRKEFPSVIEYLQFVADPANLPRMRELGLVDPVEVKSEAGKGGDGGNAGGDGSGA